MILISFLLPWWGAHSESYSYYGNEYSEGSSYAYESGGGLSLISGLGYSPGSGSMGGISLYSGDFSTPGIFRIAVILMVIALILAAIFAVSIFLCGNDILDSTSLPKTLGIIVVIICILAPIIFMVGLPGALEDDAKKTAEMNNREYEAPDHDDPTKSFFGSYSDTVTSNGNIDRTKMSWGGDIGWYMCFISFFIVLISLIMVILTDRDQRRYEMIKSYPPEPQDRFRQQEYQQPPSSNYTPQQPQDQSQPIDYQYK